MAVKRTVVSLETAVVTHEARIEALEQMHLVPHKLVEDLEELQRTVVQNGAETRERIAVLETQCDAQDASAALAAIKAQLGEWSRENRMDNLTVEYRLKRHEDDIVMLDDIPQAPAPPAQSTSPRLIIFQVWWPGQGQLDRARDIRPLALKPEDIFRVKPSAHADFTEIEVVQLVVRERPALGALGGITTFQDVERAIYSFVVAGNFAEIVARINAT